MNPVVYAYDVYNSVGVNTHFTYGLPYGYLANFSRLIGMLQAAHISHVRDAQWGNGASTQPWVTSMWTQLHVAGIQSNLVVYGHNPTLTAAQMIADLKLYPGVESIEAMNEWDYNGGSNWIWTAQQLLPTIWQAGQALHVPVIGPSLVAANSFGQLGDVSQWMNYGNVHDYQGNRNPETAGIGGNGYSSIAWNAAMAHQYAPGLPVIATETGITTGSGGVPETVQGTYAPRIFLAAFNRGFPRTYYYELVDSPYGPNFGLLHLDMTPKPAWKALSNLMPYLSDTRKDFALQPLTYALSGGGANIESLLIQKSTGVYWLFIWDNRSVWDVDQNAATPVSPTPMSLQIAGGMVVTWAGQLHEDGNVSGSQVQNSTFAFNASSNVLALRIYYPWK